MAKAKKTLPQKKRGRPATGRDPVTAIRLSTALRAQVDAWSAAQPTPSSRSEAIRRLVELGLAVKAKAFRSNTTTQRARASEMAAGALDNMADSSADADDQAQRKRRLLKGPEEFRDIRVDRKTKK